MTAMPKEKMLITLEYPSDEIFSDLAPIIDRVEKDQKRPPKVRERRIEVDTRKPRPYAYD